MPRNAVVLSEKFAGHLHYLDLTRRKMERLFLTRRVVRRDVEQVYSGLYMDSLTSFESLLEELFIGLLSGRFITADQGAGFPLKTFKNKQAVINEIYGGQNYVVWLPYRRTSDRARTFFQDGAPFTSLDGGDLNHIAQCLAVRNVIAHKSDYAKREFDKHVLARRSHLMAREKTPTGYLRSVFRQRPAQTRYEELVLGLATIATKICS